MISRLKFLNTFGKFMSLSNLPREQPKLLAIQIQTRPCFRNRSLRFRLVRQIKISGQQPYMSTATFPKTSSYQSSFCAINSSKNSCTPFPPPPLYRFTTLTQLRIISYLPSAPCILQHRNPYLEHNNTLHEWKYTPKTIHRTRYTPYLPTLQKKHICAQRAHAYSLRIHTRI